MRVVLTIRELLVEVIYHLMQTLLVIVSCGFPTQLALGALLMAAGLRPFGADGQLSMSYLAVLMPADTCLLLALVVWRIRAGGERVRDVLVGARSWRREAWLGAGLIPPFSAASS